MDKYKKDVCNRISLKIMCWNINNYFSNLMGNKLLDSDFLNVTQGYDIVGLVETHSECNDDLHIPGFGKPFVKLRPKQKNKKAYGGVAVFVKQIVLSSTKISFFNTPC